MKLLAVLVLLCLLSGFCAQAGEGFWLPRQLSGYNVVPDGQFNLANNAAALNTINHSVVKLGECSAVFVTADGLLLTSARCIAPYLTAETSAGFATAQQLEEIRLSGLTVYQPVELQDVTVSINRQLNETSNEIARSARLLQLEQELLSRCQQQGRYCRLHKLHYGLQFYLQYYQPFSDVRLVYLPQQKPLQQDDTHWPRYDADFTLLRVYQADGKAVSLPYSKMTFEGVTEQQKVLVPDFVPQSQRYSSVEELQFLFEQLYPQMQAQLKRTIDLLQELGSVQSDTIALQTALSQQYQRRQAMLSEYQQGRMIARRQQTQQRIRDWINASPVRQQLYGAALQRFRQLQQQQQQLRLRDQVLENLHYARLPALAVQLYSHALSEDTKGRHARRVSLQQQLEQLETQLDVRTDQALALHFLELYSELPQALRLPALDQYFALSDGFNREIVRHKLSAIYRLTGLTRNTSRLAWLDADSTAFASSDDPLINFAVAMQHTSQQLAQQRQQLAAELELARSALMEVIMAYNDAQNKPTYAEANGDLRFSIGKISGYQPRDAVWYLPFSRLQHSDSADGQESRVYANFLSSVDSCGDVTGAPTFDLNGQVVGVMYTGAGQRLLAKWHYDAERSRAVHVDNRFILWHLQQSDTGRSLLQQLLSVSN